MKLHAQLRIDGDGGKEKWPLYRLPKSCQASSEVDQSTTRKLSSRAVRWFHWRRSAMRSAQVLAIGIAHRPTTKSGNPDENGLGVKQHPSIQ